MCAGSDFIQAELVWVNTVATPQLDATTQLHTQTKLGKSEGFDGAGRDNGLLQAEAATPVMHNNLAPRLFFAALCAAAVTTSIIRTWQEAPRRLLRQHAASTKESQGAASRQHGTTATA